MSYVKQSDNKHALFGGSQYHWIGYDTDKLLSYIENYKAKERGTRIHAYAAESIDLGQKLPKSRKTLNMFVNDAIGFGMEPEKKVAYSDLFWGTADALSFRKNLLRIHDLKTGATPAHMEQLYIYAAFFCLQHGLKPGDIEMELRIYQSNNIIRCVPEVEDIVPIMDKTVQFDKIINEIRDRGEWI